MIRKLVFSTVLLVMTVIVHAQTNSKVTLYGFVQPVTPGTMAKGDVDENGRLIKNAPGNGTMNNYRIYLTVPESPRTYPMELWIKGEPYSVKPEIVKQTPVSVTNYAIPSHPKTTILVPKTTQKVLLLTPLPPIESKTSAKAKTLAQDHELVVVYKLSGKKYYAALEKLTELEAKAMQ